MDEGKDEKHYCQGSKPSDSGTCISSRGSNIYTDDGRVVCSGMFSATGSWRGSQKHQRKRGILINASRFHIFKPLRRSSAIEYVEKFLLDRLQQPHSNNDETFQSYSSFTTNYKPPTEYEESLVAASKSRNYSIRSWERREPLEYALEQSSALQAYGAYIAGEWRTKRIDFFTASGIYERAITEAASRRFKGESGAEETLRSFWTGYLDAAVGSVSFPLWICILTKMELKGFSWRES